MCIGGFYPDLVLVSEVCGELQPCVNAVISISCDSSESFTELQFKWRLCCSFSSCVIDSIISIDGPKAVNASRFVSCPINYFDINLATDREQLSIVKCSGLVMVAEHFQLVIATFRALE